ncbi:MAG: tRNA pseudouridine(54/55) synthase Pus10, partial [Thermodesulfobacteriota bacterium]|nr:tRNA pseudouridine(54/55) synthase Pus10 [Thermodesulfobacteriota bacterium]
KAKINKLHAKKIEVDELRFAGKREVQEIKSAKPDKTYLLTLKVDKVVTKKDLNKLDALVGVIRQRTPERVKHRRADIERKRKVYSVKYSLSKEDLLKIELKTEAGLYIKELATGDGRRTKPSIADILGTSVDVVELTVLEVG